MAVSFHDKPFAERFASMGDAAEASVVMAHDGKVTRWGLNRPPFSLRNLPAEVRGAPDFLGGKAFYEACGVGHDQVVKIKKYKHQAQMWWSELMPVIYHINDTSNHRWVEIEASEVQRLIDEGHVPLLEFPSDKVEYWALGMELVMANACDGGPSQ